MGYRSFEDLEVWRKGCRLAVRVYGELRECRDYGMRDQMTRAAVSIASNIAEGAERNSTREYIRFIHIAKGSAAELRTQLYISAEIGLLPRDTVTALTSELKHISAMLQKTATTLQTRLKPKTQNPQIT